MTVWAAVWVATVVWVFALVGAVEDAAAAADTLDDEVELALLVALDAAALEAAELLIGAEGPALAAAAEMVATEAGVAEQLAPVTAVASAGPD